MGGPRAVEPSIDLAINRLPAFNKTQLSEDDYSSFSSTEDFLPDETNEPSNHMDMSSDPDFAAVRRFAELMARRRSVTIEEILPQIVDLFFGNQAQVIHNDEEASYQDRQQSFVPKSSRDPSPVLESRKTSSIEDGLRSLRRSRKFKSTQRPLSYYLGDDSNFNTTSIGTKAIPDQSMPHSKETYGVEEAKSTFSMQTSTNEAGPPFASPPLSRKDRGENSQHIYNMSSIRQRRPPMSTSISSQTTIIHRSPASATGSAQRSAGGSRVVSGSGRGSPRPTQEALLAAISAVASAAAVGQEE